ncbi:hypothetical protein BGW41_004385 [Actinomortierella wolfii]|nr:hypothetical protein BGW41_004385 [Actinomortierella wolfii]
MRSSFALPTLLLVALVGMLTLLSPCTVAAFRPSTLFRFDSPPGGSTYKVGQTIKVHAALREGDDLFVNANVEVVLSLRAPSSSSSSPSGVTNIPLGSVRYQTLAGSAGYEFVVKKEYIDPSSPAALAGYRVRGSFIYNDSPLSVDSSEFYLSK